MTLILIVAALTLAASFMCSVLEAALYSVTPAQLDVLAKQGTVGARRFKRFRAHIDGPIAAILTINTVAHTVGATVLGALVGAEFGGALGWFTALFTLAVLFLTEIVPKSLGVKFGARLIPFLVWPLQFFIWISWPIARLCSWLMHKLTGTGAGHLATEAEVIALAKTAQRQGALSEFESLWVENALLLDQVTARDLMTPRTVVQSLATGMTLAEVQRRPEALRHSRLPVTERAGDLDHVNGVVYRRDIYDAIAHGDADSSVDALLQPLEFIPETMRAPQLLAKFLRDKRHILAVADEYGGLEGIVTLEDVLEALLGAEIVDEHDEHVDMQAVARARAERSLRRRRGTS